MIDINILLAWGAAYKKINAGDIIFQEGQSCIFYNQLVSGRVKWMNIDDEGKECIQYMVEGGESFGELPLFDDEPYAASAIAEKDCLIIRLHKSTFLQILNENPKLHFEFTRLLSKRMRFKFAIIKALSSHCPEIRISTIINHLRAENKNFCPNCNQLDLTRQQIADMTGLRVETVIRTMRNMHNKGELLISKGKVFCTNMIERIPA